MWGVCLPLILSIRTPVDSISFGEAVSWIVQPFSVLRSPGSIRLPEWAGEEEKETKTRK